MGPLISGKFRLVKKNTLPETNSSLLKIDDWNTTFLWEGLFSGATFSLREGKHSNKPS